MSTTGVGSATEAGRFATRWAVATVALSVAAVAAAVVLAPADAAEPTSVLVLLLFVGSSVHVASTGWFFTVPEVRAHARRHPGRYVAAPAGLVLTAAAVAAVLAPATFVWLLLPFFAWQFFHFQKQNLGLAALAASSCGAASLDRPERTALLAVGALGIAGLLTHPHLLGLDLEPAAAGDVAHTVAAIGYAVAVAVGVVVLLVRRRRADRPAAFVALSLVALLFFAPAFAFSSPVAAVSGMVIAHGCQYLVLVGLVALGTPGSTSRVVAVFVLVNVALVGGLALSVASHLHTGDAAARAVYGAFVGITMAHFVVDAGLWRLRDRFPRRFLGTRLPALVPTR